MEKFQGTDNGQALDVFKQLEGVFGTTILMRYEVLITKKKTNKQKKRLALNFLSI